MNLMNYIAGPQLIGIIFFMAGVIMQRYPPKQINSLYGYRTNASMKNQQTWDEGNRFSARWMLRGGMLLFIFGLVLTLILKAFVTQVKTQSAILGVSLLFSAIITAVLLIVITERHLNKTFNNQDEVR